MYSQTSTVGLLDNAIFSHQYAESTRAEDLEHSYRRAQAIGKLHNVSIKDLIELTPKFWKLHYDNIIAHDPVAHILVSIQLNLAAGTLAPYAVQRPDLQPLMRQILSFEVSSSFMLNEVGHGCDARNLETTATRESDGTFTLHTPNKDAVKFMPPSMPMAGIRRIAIVFARLIVESEDRGIRPFVVPINDGQEMCRGIQSRLLSSITGGRMLDHALTSFDHVRLPAGSMLGDLAKPLNERDQYLHAIQRLSTGTLALTLWILPFLKCATFIAGRYSQKRTVQQGIRGTRAPILHFRTQQLPILHAVAQVAVIEAYANWATDEFSNNKSLHPGTRYGLSVILKNVMIFDGQKSLGNLMERSGAQGMYPHNQMATFEALTRATGIAEGEILVLSIRLATELLIKRYEIPQPRNPHCLLAKHEMGVISELKTRQTKIKDHRSHDYNNLILPHCRSMVLAIGQRMAYEAALDAGVDRSLLDLYEAGAIASDPGWYIQNLGITREELAQLESRAADVVLPHLDAHLSGLDIEPFCTAPMLSSGLWQNIVESSTLFTGNSFVSVPGVEREGSKL